MKQRVALLMAFASLCAACANSALTTTGPSTALGTVTDNFASFLAIGGASIHRFSVTQAGTITVTLNVITPAGVIGLGIGVPDAAGTGCNLTNAMDASAAVVDSTTGIAAPQLTIASSPGAYCVEVYDSGQLASVGRTFSITIAHT
jgi:hypothetical protein